VHIAKLTRALCEPALSLVCGERRVAESIDLLTCHLARLGRCFLAELLGQLCLRWRRHETQLDQAADRFCP
jgi:hypothetical protein